MHEQIVATYRALMTSLHTLPNEIAAAQADLTKEKLDLAASDRLVTDFEAKCALEIEGKNAEERKAKLTQYLAKHNSYQVLEAQARRHRMAVATLTNDVDNLTRQFAAVGHASKLHTGLMAYLAEAAPGKEFDVTFGADPAIATNGNGTITAADAEELGL